MSEIFLKIINMSISASYIVLAVLLLRLLLKKAPKWITVLLWGIVAVRLICPFSIESVLSLIPSAETISPQVLIENPEINTGFPILNNALNPIIQESTVTVAPEKSINALKLSVLVFSKVWIIGLAAMLIYTVISYFNLKRKIGTAVLVCDNIYQSENVVSPFVMGIIKPKIYLPFNINKKDMEHVVAHETAHIHRKDHWWKPLGFLLLALHWFNPLMWLGYVLLCRDIELACDQKVIKEFDHDARADYSQALLTCSVNRRMIAVCPLAFGEIGVKKRVKSVLNYKKPAFWIIIAAVVACVTLAVCFLTNPINLNTSVDDDLKVFIDCQIAEKNQKLESENRACCLDWEVIGKKQHGSTTTLYMWVLYKEYSYDGRSLKSEAGSHTPTVITVEKKDGHYKLIEYWQPQMGSYYSSSIKEKFPWYLHIKALDPQRYSNLQEEKCWQMALDYFDLPPSFSNVDGDDKLNSLIYGSLPPASDSDIISDVCIQDFWCSVKDVSIDFKQIRIENREIIFDIHWKNDSASEIDIGPDFVVYKYDKDKPIKLEHKGVWLYYSEVLNGKGMTTDSNSELETERTTSYNISEHYDVLTPGKYRFETHGAWAEFQIINKTLLDSAEFDIDGDGIEEFCQLIREPTSGVFAFSFLAKDKRTGKVKYLELFYSPFYFLSFQKDTGGITKIKAVTQGETPKIQIFDISIENGKLAVTQNGISIGHTLRKLEN